jgi:hypothetical protein
MSSRKRQRIPGKRASVKGRSAVRPRSPEASPMARLARSEKTEPFRKAS